MHGHHNGHHHNPKRQAQDVLPKGQAHVNGAAGGPMSPSGGGKGAGKGGGNKAPPGGNGKAPAANGAAAKRSLDTRMAVLETEHKHLATKADLEKGLSGLRTELHATELRLTREAQKNKEELRREAQKNKEELRREIQGVKDGLHAEMRRMPYVILGGMAGLVTVVAFGPQAIEWLQRLLG